MSTSQHLLHIFSFALFFFMSRAAEKPHGLILPIRKNSTTLQYYTEVDMGTPLSNANVVIDLGGELLWFDCDGYNSSSYHLLRCNSSKCKAATTYECTDCNYPYSSDCSKNFCGVYPYNPLGNGFIEAGLALGEDIMSVSSTDGISYLLSVEARHFPFTCRSTRLGSILGSELSGGTKGMIGLSRARSALSSQLASAFKLPHKFALCLPNSSATGPGDIFIGGGPYYMLPYGDVSKELMTTPLILNPVNNSPTRVGESNVHSDEYFIGVKSIHVDRKHVSFKESLLSINKKGIGGTKLSTLAPYTILQTSIYKALVKDFVKAAASRKIKRVTSVAPFGACFSSKTIASSQTGPAVPVIHLQLQSKSMYFRIYGANSMVEVEKDVLCLGFVDGGSNPTTSVVLGGHQLENYLLEFDLASSKLGFSTSLLLRNTTCSHYRLF
ncbi:hypothetical protein RJ640_028885 [Escallonia rubra]|uniref:Peptidase A1 domain-containing protein n=1 Tax=Escallonia rubra TaxID=112253 RepID=A0AA88QPX1_9ASTE|nr:hypothetical protein RJ640_028885 [Escallonia rubra]